jgi:alginate O-acetyltransferase complex protein AlgJ
MRSILVGLFMTIISMPLGLNLAGRDGGDPEGENRELAAFSVTNLSAWFDDHFGLRSTFVRWYGEIELGAFDISPSASVLKGQHGWFFYADDKAVEDYISEDPLTPDALANWRSALVRAHRWLQKRQIGYLFVIAPDKHVLYPEEMPTTVLRIGTMSRTDQFYGSLQDTGLLVDVRPSLADQRARERIYQKTDTHWNDRGAFVAYQAIIGAARGQVPGIPAAWVRDDFEAVSRDVAGKDLAGMMGLTRVLREEDLVLVPKRRRLAHVVEPVGGRPTDEEGRLVTEIPGSPLPSAVIFRDSFASQLAPFLSEHFSRAVYLWQNDFDAQVVQEEHPDIVIQEIVGRHLYNFIPSPELVPGEDAGENEKLEVRRKKLEGRK